MQLNEHAQLVSDNDALRADDSWLVTSDAVTPGDATPDDGGTDEQGILSGWRGFLQAVIADAPTHARWLNTLSLMEHIGSRKIIKALDASVLDETLLRHIAEEARHAHIFKRLSLRAEPDLCTSYANEHLFCGDASRNYFQSLDTAVHAYVQEAIYQQVPLVTYLCVTTLIEIRATQIYEIYEELLRKASSPLSLRTVLAEEDRHLEEMAVGFSHCGFDWGAHAPRLTRIESDLMRPWLSALREGLSEG